MTVSELCSKFKEKIYILDERLKNSKYILLRNAEKIDINSLKTVVEYFRLGNLDYSSTISILITFIPQ